MALNADVNAIDDFNLSPLHYACSKKNPSIVEELLKSEDINLEVSKIVSQ